MTKTIYHICNEGTLQINGGENIYSISAIPKNIDNAQSIFLVNVHLNWEGRHLSKNYGFEIANELRTKLKSKAPIIFYSPIQKEYFEQKSEKEIKYKILFGRGSAFLEAPFKESDFKKLLESIEPLSNAALHDVTVSSCDLKGIVIEKLKHDLKFEQGEEVVVKTIKSVSPYLNEAQKNEIKLSTYLTVLSDKVKQNDKSGFETERESFIRLCVKFLTSDNFQQDISSTKEDKNKHKVVVVEDETDFLQYVVDNLSDSFIVVPFDNAEDAWKYLQSDDGLAVRAVVSDWRLKNGLYMQQMQGYELLEHTGKIGFRALFTLSMQAEFLVHQIRNKIGVRFTMYKKDNLEEPGQWKAFKDLLEQQCNEMNEVIAAMPDKASWMKPQKKRKHSYYEEYLEKRNSTEWESFESGITESSNLIWHDYYLKYLKGELDESLQDFSKRFGLLLNSIEAILTARRICLALYFKQSSAFSRLFKEDNPRIHTYCIFRSKSFDEEVETNRNEHGDEYTDKEGKTYSIEEWTKKLLNGAATSLLNTELGFNLEEVVSFKGILPEEKNWLNRNGIEFSLQYYDYDQEEDSDPEEDTNKKEPTDKDLKNIDDFFRNGNTLDDDEADNFI
ncbi:MAG: hypothetical protein U0T84_12360 [Chitinophagales bacterium]